jgi:hypothetical protein
MLKKKSSNRGRGISSLVWKNRKLGKVVVLNSIFHRKLVEALMPQTEVVGRGYSLNSPLSSGWSSSRPWGYILVA